MNRQFTHGSLFSGIGGFDLGFERAGFKTVWQVEIDPYCRRVLEKNFPDAKRFDDIHDVVRWHHLDWVDVISGGFPCQDISNAGKRTGIDGERSGLWSEMWRVIRAMAPRFVVVENVSALLGRGMERVLGDLASGGYDAEWDVLPASAFGAPHIRQRVFIVAYASLRGQPMCGGTPGSSGHASQRSEDVADSTGRAGELQPSEWQDLRNQSAINGSSRTTPDVAYAERFPGQVRAAEGQRLGRLAGGGEDVADTNESGRNGRAGIFGERRRGEPSYCDWWAVEPRLDRVAYGVPHRVERLKGLGNAVVPQIAEWLAQRIKVILERDEHGNH